MAGRRRGKRHEEHEEGEAWLLPYSDLMTLLLAVFIVLFAVSQTDEAKTSAMAQSFRDNFLTGGSSLLDGSDSDSSIIDSSIEGMPPVNINENTGNSSSGTGTGQNQEATNIDSLKNELETYFEYEGINTIDSDNPSSTEGTEDAMVSVGTDNRGLVITLKDSILFDSGSAGLKSDPTDLLVEIGKIVSHLDNYIRVEGHSDNIPTNANSIYPSNWELSAARASTVVRLLIEKCGIDPEKIVPMGYSQYKPIADNSTREGRAQNRRVEIIVLNEKYTSLETHSDTPADEETVE